MMNPPSRFHLRRLASLLLPLILALAFAAPTVAYAQGDEAGEGEDAAESAQAAASADGDQQAGKVVRVGWYESPYNTTDQFGRRSGYAYEYQRKVAAYTGWTFEYVEGTWPKLLQMLVDGEIDLMSDVSYTEGRTQDMLFPSVPMGTEAYYVFASPENEGITSDDYTSLNGKRVGVTRGSVQKDIFLEWAQKHGVEADLVELIGSEEESMRMLKDGRLDAFVTLDVYGNSDYSVPVWKIGSSDFYFAVNKDRADLLDELNVALDKIQDENMYFNQQMHEKHFSNASPTMYLSPAEKDWLSEHGTIRVGYQDNYLAFCASDPVTGELTGALGDYLEYASTCMENAQIDFEAVAYPTAAAALEALKNGEVDCMFPANLTDYDGEALGVVMTPPLMRTEMDAVVREADQREFIRKDQVVVAVNQGNTNYEMFLLDNYPGWQIAYFPDTPTGLEGVAAGEADCVIISNYRFSNISKQCEALHLTTVYTGVDMDYYLAVREGDTQLYSILTKITDVVPDSAVHAALTYYSTADVKTSFVDVVKDNLVIVLGLVTVVALAIIALLVRSIRAERKAREEEHLVDDLNKRVFVDPLTSVRNRGAFDDFVQGLQDRVDNGERLEIAIGVFDCDNLKTVNDKYGHDKGNEYLKAASRLICRVFQHSPVFRIGGDEFVAVLQNEDFENRVDLIDRFDIEQAKVNAQVANPWEEVHVSLGVAVYNPGLDNAVSDTARRADKAMYENKRIGKNAG